MAASKEFGDRLIAERRYLKSFALSLSKNESASEDLVQETMFKALKSSHLFQEGTNFRAWLTTILRNQYFSDFRKKRHEAEDPDGVYAGQVSRPATQQSFVEFGDFLELFNALGPEHKEILYLISFEGISYEESAKRLGVALGTIKSRVHRARESLHQLLDGNRIPAGIGRSVQNVLALAPPPRVRALPTPKPAPNLIRKIVVPKVAPALLLAPLPIVLQEPAFDLEMCGTKFVFRHSIIGPDGIEQKVYAAI
ncbi:MAG: polymerase subunit sigma [Candidatus Adlerbacteria bacterium]|nr:polymerase subunit sigma [Candidatus Adlerbacteria bacterium]